MQKASPPARRDPEAQDLRIRRRVRMGLAFKFMGPVALATALVIGGMGLSVHQTAASALEGQFVRQGLLAARLAATPDLDTWRETSTTSPEEDARRRADNRQRLARIIAATPGGLTGTLDVWIQGEAGQPIARASAGSPRIERGGEAVASAASPRTAMRRGRYDGEPARFFEHPILGAGDQRLGLAVVVQSEARLQADLEALDRELILFCVLGILGSALVAFVTSKVVTRPLDHLLRDIRTVASGRFDHRTRARSDDEIGALATAFDQMTRNLHTAEAMRQDLAEKEHEVGLAAEVQSRLVPKELPRTGALQLAAAQHLHGATAADLYDALPLADGRVGLFLMSASAAGLPAAIVLSMARASFRALAPIEARPAEALRRINRVIAPDLRRGMFVSALYVVIDAETGEGLLASAGHRVPALHYLAEPRGLRRLQADGIAIGLDHGPVFDQSLTETPFRLEPGDRLLLASEGAFQMQKKDGTPVDETVFLKAILALQKDGITVDRFLEAFAARIEAAPGPRDVTFFQATRIPRIAPATRAE